MCVKDDRHSDDIAVMFHFVWIAPDGTQRFFYINTQKDVSCGVQNIPSGTACTQDSSGST